MQGGQKVPRNLAPPLATELAQRDFVVGILDREIRGSRTDARRMAPL